MAAAVERARGVAGVLAATKELFLDATKELFRDWTTELALDAANEFGLEWGLEKEGP